MSRYRLTDEQECEDEYVSDEDDDDGDSDDDKQEFNDIVLSAIGDDVDVDEAPPLVSCSGRRIDNRSTSDYSYFQIYTLMIINVYAKKN